LYNGSLQPVTKRQFGVSTHLFHGQRLSREHLLEIAAHGFETVELFATRSHFDYHNPAAILDLQQWLAEAGLTLHGIHAPVMTAYEGGRWIGPLNLASSDPDGRAQAVSETEHAIHIARRIPVNVLVTHIGLPRTASSGAPADARSAARRSIEELQPVVAPLGVRIALEVIPNELSRAGSLVHFVENELDGLEGPETGVCLDFGHAHMDGDLLDAIETVAEHLVTTHVHDNGGRSDDHLVPFHGTIDWPSALTAVQKIGYDGPLLFEVGARGSARDTLAMARRAREKMERLLAQ
jgi:sugar phosphate isomerase/epimerase